MIFVQCDECGLTASAVWDFRMGIWRVPEKWQRHSIHPEPGKVGAHACSADCQKKHGQSVFQQHMREQFESDQILAVSSDVEARRRSFRLVK